MSTTESFINITNKQTLSIRGVNDITEYDSERIILDMSGEDLIICGENFNIKKIDVENKVAEITGEIYSLSFVSSTAKNKKSFLTSLFK